MRRLTLPQWSRYRMLALAGALLVQGCAPTAPRAQMAERSDRPPQLVYAVEAVELTVLESAPPTLCITASGIVRSGGWSAARLRTDATRPDQNGVVEFRLEATPPPLDAMVTQALSPIASAPFCWRDYPADLLTIRVQSERNALERAVH